MTLIRRTTRPVDRFFDDFHTNSIAKIMDEMDRQFQSLMNWDYPIKGKILGSGFPKTDIIYNKEDNTVQYICDIPGWNKEDIDIDISPKDNCMTISASKSEERKSKGEILLHERKSTQFKRTFPLPLEDQIDADKIEAKFENGQLEITVPLIEPIEEEVTNKKIKIK